MPNTIRLLALAGGLCFLLLITAMAQEKRPVPDMTPKRVDLSSLTSSTEPEGPTRYAIPGKRASQYTKEDWGKIVDSTWGPGQSVTDQLQVFDQFWDLVDKKWAGFPNLPLSWDSLRNVYRPQIGAGLSRGRFYALMSRLWMGLQELHTCITDDKVESVFNDAGRFRYRRGVPLLMMGPGGSLIGAAVLPLPDSTNVVYNVVPGNPLGLEPGDLVLGYEGVPWKQLYRKLLDAGLPVSFNYSWFGSTPESQSYFFLLGVQFQSERKPCQYF